MWKYLPALSASSAVVLAVSAASALLLGFAVHRFVAARREKAHRAELREKLVDLASLVVADAAQIADAVPGAKAMIQSLLALTESRTGRKLQEQEKLLGTLAARARVLAMGAKEIVSNSAALASEDAPELMRRLVLLQADEKQMRGIWVTFDATISVLRSSEQAMRKARGAARDRSPGA